MVDEGSEARGSSPEVCSAKTNAGCRIENCVLDFNVASTGVAYPI